MQKHEWFFVSVCWNFLFSSERGDTGIREGVFTLLEGIVPQGSEGHTCHAFGPLTLVHIVPEEFCGGRGLT